MDKFFVFFIIILLIGGFAASYYFYNKEKFPTISNSDNFIYRDVFVQIQNDHKNIEASYQIHYLNETITSQSSKGEFIKHLLPENNSFYIVTYNGQGYYNTRVDFDYQYLLGRDAKITIPVQKIGFLNVTQDRGIDRTIAPGSVGEIGLDLSTEDTIQNLAICVRWNPRFLDVWIENITAIEIRSNLINQVDKCYGEINLNDEDLSYLLKYKTVSQLSQDDTIKLYFTDLDLIPIYPNSTQYSSDMGGIDVGMKDVILDLQ